MAGPSVETSIWLALRGRVESLALSPALPILWPGEGETLPPGNCLEVTHFPNATERPWIGSDEEHRYQGILQIAVLTVPGASHHETVAREIAGQVAAHFPADKWLNHAGVSVRVTRRPDVSRGLRDKERARWMTLVSVRYVCDA